MTEESWWGKGFLTALQNSTVPTTVRVETDLASCSPLPSLAESACSSSLCVHPLCDFSTALFLFVIHCP